MICEFRGGGGCVHCGYVPDSMPTFRNCPVLLNGRVVSDIVIERQDFSIGIGAGTELQEILKNWLGIVSDENCGCRATAARMNRLGPDWCEGEGMAEIIDVMRAEHGKRWADGRTILPWTDMGARQLVLLACRRAKATG